MRGLAIRKANAAFTLTALTCWALADMSPDSLSTSLSPGGSVTETKTVTIARTIPKADIVFAFDLTGSMSDEIDVAKAEAGAIMEQVATLVGDPRFGVVSFMDYPRSYGTPPDGADNGGYVDTYGEAADYAYRLDLAPTGDTAAVATAIDALALGSGWDGPQDYSRILYESYTDTAFAYRPGAKKIVILFGDSIPHDTNVFEGLDGYPVETTGKDPGRDEEINTADDLDWQTVLDGMVANGVTLLSIHSSGYSLYESAWEAWAAQTGGGSYPLASAAEIPDAIAALVGSEASHIDSLTLVTDPPEYAGWLTSVEPSAYEQIDLVDELTEFGFELTLTVPVGTEPGTYEFRVVAMADGAEYGAQDVSITTNRPPDVSGAQPSVGSLWPPNHQQVAIDVLGVTDPDGDPVTITIDGISQDEPVNCPGDGDTAPDGGGVGTSAAWVRAERCGVDGNGRVYVIAFTASDGNGGTATGSLSVVVPCNQKKDCVVVDDGQDYDSTAIE